MDDLPDLEHGGDRHRDAPAGRCEREGGDHATTLPEVPAACDSYWARAGGVPTLPGGQADRNQGDRREPPRAVRLPAARAARGRDRAHRHRGEVAARGAGHARAGVRGRPRHGGLADRRRDRRVRAREHREPRARSRPQAAAQARRDLLARRQGAREGPDDRADAALLQGRQGEGRARARPRQGAGRQAARHRRSRREAADGARAEDAGSASRSPRARSRRPARARSRGAR